MKPATPGELVAIRERAEKAWDGPWFTKDRGTIAVLIDVRAITANSCKMGPGLIAERDPNYEFVASARTDIPAIFAKDVAYLLGLLDARAARESERGRVAEGMATSGREFLDAYQSGHDYNAIDIAEMALNESIMAYRASHPATETRT